MAAATPQQGRHPRAVRSASHVHPLQWQFRRHLQSNSMICGYCLYALYSTVCVRLWNWTCFSLIGHTSSKNRNQFCLLSPPLLISLSSLHSSSLYLAPFSKTPLRASPSAAGLLTLRTFLSSSFFVALTCVVITPREYSALTGSVEAGCHSADQMGPQFTMSIGRQPSVSASVPQLRWGESCLSCSSTLFNLWN